MHQQIQEIPVERRLYARLPFDCPVRWSAGDTSGTAERRGVSRDVSESGAGFTVRPLSAPEIGDRIRVVFELESEIEWVVDERARVTRCAPRHDGLYDVGVALSPC
jgi:hypothetical protein